MRKTLDAMFVNKKLSILIPLLSAAAVYLLFLLFGMSDEKINILLRTPFLSALCFFVVFLIIFIQVKNASCPEWFLNLAELLFTIAPGICSVIGVVSFVISGFQDFDESICIGMVIYSAISWAHSKRPKI